MAKKWDRLMKMLARANPQHFVNQVIDNGIQFDTEMARELTARAIEADVLFITIDQNGQKIIIHIEFQTHSQEPDPFERDGFAEMGWYLLVFSTGSPDQSQPERIVWI